MVPSLCNTFRHVRCVRCCYRSRVRGGTEGWLSALDRPSEGRMNIWHVSRLRVSHSGSRATGRIPNGSAESCTTRIFSVVIVRYQINRGKSCLALITLFALTLSLPKVVLKLWLTDVFYHPNVFQWMLLAGMEYRICTEKKMMSSVYSELDCWLHISKHLFGLCLMIICATFLQNVFM